MYSGVYWRWIIIARGKCCSVFKYCVRWMFLDGFCIHSQPTECGQSACQCCRSELGWCTQQKNVRGSDAVAADAVLSGWTTVYVSPTTSSSCCFSPTPFSTASLCHSRRCSISSVSGRWALHTGIVVAYCFLMIVYLSRKWIDL